MLKPTMKGIRKVKFTLPETIRAGKYSTLAILDIGENSTLEAMKKPLN
jgi:hypothetical protein